ncbi:MAG: tRNA (cytidine(34)-2'-O)-methyltransferase [Candidatus Riflebacteria bacterium]|nr:tRNA (cytidine(34)-2'-O)-methyltransferase [Candidatus Riflebacteria bacterium]
MTEPIFSVALLMPDIPQNTGNIGRLCLASGCELVMVRPLGFRLTDSLLLRSGMDYWRKLNPVILDDLEEFQIWAENRRVWYMSAHGKRNYAEISYQQHDVFCFGSEASGLPCKTMENASANDTLVTLPMVPQARCLNVSSAAAIIVYEGLRQLNAWSPK